MPEHHPDGSTRDPNEGPSTEDPPEVLISEPSCCPYCQVQEFGVTYEAPGFRRGLAYASSTDQLTSAAMSSQTSLSSSNPPASPTGPLRRRTHSLSANAPNVITTDRVRPDWSTKLESARNHQARRHAAATALHTAAFVVPNSDPADLMRYRERFSRRAAAASAQPEGNAATGVQVEGGELDGQAQAQNTRSARRTRMDELEEMMFMEAVRLSIAEEEQRRHKQDKAQRKEAKKREKEERKAQKKASKDPYSGGPSGASGSSLSLGFGRKRGNSNASALRMEATVQGASQASGETVSQHQDKPEDKGKGVDRSEEETPATSQAATSSSLPIPPRGNSHLRQMSNASSLSSFPGDTPTGSYRGEGFENGKTQSDDSDREGGSEPLFNYRSLAEMVGVDIDTGNAHEENEDGENPTATQGSSSLPLVKEEKEDETEAEHVEGPRMEDSLLTIKPTQEAESSSQRIEEEESSESTQSLAEDEAGDSSQGLDSNATTQVEEALGDSSKGEEASISTTADTNAAEHKHVLNLLDNPIPEVMITPNTPNPGAGDDKRLGHATNITEHPQETL